MKGDLAESSFRIRLAVPLWLMVVLAAMMLRRTGQLDRGTQLFLIWIAGPLLALAVATVGSWLLGGVARRLLGTMIAQGGEPAARGYSEQEALLAAGRGNAAADSFRAHLVAYPDDLEARIRLARLLITQGHRTEPARLLHDARCRDGAGTAEPRISVALADLHRRTGDRPALIAELAHCARTCGHTAMGERARRELRDIVSRHDPVPVTDPASPDRRK